MEWGFRRGTGTDELQEFAVNRYLSVYVRSEISKLLGNICSSSKA